MLMAAEQSSGPKERVGTAGKQWYSRFEAVRFGDGCRSGKDTLRAAAGTRARASVVQERQKTRYKKVSEECMSVVFLMSCLWRLKFRCWVSVRTCVVVLLRTFEQLETQSTAAPMNPEFQRPPRSTELWRDG